MSRPFDAVAQPAVTVHRGLARLLGHHHLPDLHVLHNGAFRRLWLARLVSVTGSFAQAIAIAWVILHGGGGIAALGLCVALAALPGTVTTLYGGALASRVPLGRLLIASQSVLVVNALTLAVLDVLGLLGVGVLILSATVAGAVGALTGPAMRTCTREVVGDADLTAAVALSSLEFNAARLLGPGIAGLLLSVAGPAVCFALSAASFATMIAVVPTLGLSTRHRPARGSLLGEIWAGVAFARRTPALASIMLVVFGLGLFGFNVAVMAPLVAHELLGGGPADFGLVTMLAAAGGILASFVALAVRRITVHRILLAAAALAASLLLIGVAPAGRSVVLVEMFLFGLSGTIFLTTAGTMVQLLAQQGLEGSIMALYLLGVVGTTPLGSLLLGLLAHRFGTNVALTAMGLACGLVVLGAAIHARRNGVLRAELPSPAAADS